MTQNKEKRNSASSLDAYFMKGATACVKAWNWTTGQTKAELANTALTTSFIISSAAIGIDNVIMIPISMAVFFPQIYLRQKINTKMEKLEADALKNNCLDAQAESYKETCKILGPSKAITCGGLSALTASIKPGEPGLAMLLSIKALVETPSHYFMRVDYVPPKKNVLARGWEKAKKLIRTAEVLPLPVPAMCLIAKR